MTPGEAAKNNDPCCFLGWFFWVRFFFFLTLHSFLFPLQFVTEGKVEKILLDAQNMLEGTKSFSKKRVTHDFLLTYLLINVLILKTF